MNNVVALCGIYMVYIYIYTWNPFVLCFASKRRSFPIQTRDIWVPGIYIYIKNHAASFIVHSAEDLSKSKKRIQNFGAKQKHYPRTPVRPSKTPGHTQGELEKDLGSPSLSGARPLTKTSQKTSRIGFFD